MYKNLIDIVIPKPYNKTPNKRKIFQHNLFIDFFLKSCGPSHAFRKSFISSFVRQVSLLLNAFSPQKSATIFFFLLILPFEVRNIFSIQYFWRNPTIHLLYVLLSILLIAYYFLHCCCFSMSKLSITAYHTSHSSP